MSKKYTLQRNPFVVPTPDDKLIEEHFGQASNGDKHISIAHMIAPPGWGEPAQAPEFDEYTYIIRGKKQIEVEGEKIVLSAGESIKIARKVRVRYSNPFDEPCEYIAVCTPAFQFAKAHRESE
jgi:mannose-6-phosphate isomerase-like protein (cupin superfamily)